MKEGECSLEGGSKFGDGPPPQEDAQRPGFPGRESRDRRGQNNFARFFLADQKPEPLIFSLDAGELMGVPNGGDDGAVHTTTAVTPVGTYVLYRLGATHCDPLVTTMMDGERGAFLPSAALALATQPFGC